MTGTAVATGRRLYLDNLKTALIMLIIVIHAVLGYAGTMDAWTYTEFREVTLSPATEIPLFVLAAPFALFMIGLLFLVAGLLTGPSLARKGPGRFARDRLLRLGVPFVLYVLLLQPTVTYALQHPLGDAPGSFAEEWLAEEEGHRLDTGPLWFVGVLLVFSLMVAAGAAVSRRRSGPPALREPAPVTVRALLLLAGAVAVSSFLVRLAYPYGGESGFSDLNFWEWPGCLAAFGLGLAGSRRGWADAVPEGLARTSRTLTLAAASAMALLLLVAGLRDRVDAAMGGPSPYAAAFSVVDGLLVVFGPVWLLTVARRRLGRTWPAGPALARSAFAAFILQTPVLVGLAGALRPVPVAAEVKAVVVAAVGLTLCFALARLLLDHVPGVRRVL